MLGVWFSGFPDLLMFMLLLSYFSHVLLFLTVACQTPLSMGFSSVHGISPPSGYLPHPGIKSASQADSLLLSHGGGPIHVYFA